ncbi:amino acid permease [Aneurinibacillus terranovensis]|uniref:amino acid permease n=1 Tax=Aneurinibacillus terranovensis TaxID=278991 RepID=UPI00041AAA4C|nr:amino acid permease [Aneurinibacillus terranovensis]
MENKNLQQGLLPRHVRMMAIGGMIGAGMFKGSSDTLSLAGPSVVFAYLSGGILLLVIMGALAEMAGVYAKADIRELIKKAFGTRASFVMGWLYWINWVLVMAVEIVAAGTFIQYWFPAAPLWLLSLLVALAILVVNLSNVKYYGEVEFWISAVKVMALVSFIVLGGSLLTGVFSGNHVSHFTNYTIHGGFFPKGWHGLFSSLLVVMFSYGGSELIGLTITETKDAGRVLPKIINGIMWRVILFYTLPLLVICGLIPWDEVSGKASPFVQVLASVGLKDAAELMNFIMLTAVFSAANSGMYATSRMLYSLAKNGDAPAVFERTSKNGVPIFGLVASAVCLFIGVIAAYITPANVFHVLMGIPGFTVMLVWISICLAQLKLRSTYPAAPLFTLRFFPLSTLFTACSLLIIFLTILFDPNNKVSSLLCIGIVIFLLICAGIRPEKKHRKNSGSTFTVGK